MRKVIKHWTTIRNCMAGLALVCAMLAAGTSDFHVMEMGEEAPTTVNKLMVTAVVLMIPTIIHLIGEYIKEKTNY